MYSDVCSLSHDNLHDSDNVTSFKQTILFSFLHVHLPPHRSPSGIVMASSAGRPGFNPPSITASYQRRYKNGTSSSLVWYSTLKGKYWFFLKN